jgi:hypothetical protein
MYKNRIINSIRKLDPKYLGTKWLMETTDLDPETGRGRYKKDKVFSRYSFAIFGEAVIAGVSAAASTLIGINELLLNLSYKMPTTFVAIPVSLAASVAATAVIMRGKFAEHEWPYGTLDGENFDKMQRYLYGFR